MRPQARYLQIFTPFFIGFFLTSIYRTINAVLAPSIGMSLSLSAESLGIVTSIYFLLFALCQPLLGLALDMYGPRAVQLVTFTIAGIGSILFGAAEGFLLLLVGRILIGAGMSGGMMNGLTAARLWLPRSNMPMFNSLLIALGSLGAAVAARPTQLLLMVMGWRTISIVLGVITIGMGIITFMLVPTPDHLSETKIHWKEHLKGLGKVFSDRYFWHVAPIMVFTIGIFSMFQSFWLIPYVEKVYGLPAAEAGYLLLYLALTMIVGLLSSGFVMTLFTKMGLRINQIIGAGVIISIVFEILVAIPAIPHSVTLWCLYTFFAMFGRAWFATIAQHFPKEYAGRATTGINMLLFFGIFVMQLFFGVIASAFSNIAVGMLVAFWIYIILQSASFFWFLLGRGHFNGEVITQNE